MDGRLAELKKIAKVEAIGESQNIGTEDTHQEFQGKYTKSGNTEPIHPQTKLRLVAGKAFFGPGTQQLLELVEQTGSLQDACLSMKLSYSKGSRMIKDAERQLGFPISQRWAGGTGGGGSRLTEEGKRFLQSYRNMAFEVQEFTEQIYKKYFGENA